MKVKVIKSFIDKNTKKVNEVGSVIEVSETRLKEILAVGKFVEVVKTAKPKKTSETEVEEITE